MLANLIRVMKNHGGPSLRSQVSQPFFLEVKMPEFDELLKYLRWWNRKLQSNDPPIRIYMLANLVRVMRNQKIEWSPKSGVQCSTLPTWKRAVHLAFSACASTLPRVTTTGVQTTGAGSGSPSYGQARVPSKRQISVLRRPTCRRDRVNWFQALANAPATAVRNVKLHRNRNSSSSSWHG